jgi:hypothetical protein
MMSTALGLTSVGAGPAGAFPSITTYVSGLNTPRGLTFDGDGNLYVAESGVAGSGPDGLTMTGRVTKYRRGSTSVVWSSQFESLYATIDPSQPPDVLGPEGMSAVGERCRKGRASDETSATDSEMRSADGTSDGTADGRSDGGSDRRREGQGCQIRMIMSESHDGVLKDSEGNTNSAQLGHLFAINSETGVATEVSNVGDQNYQWTADHHDLFEDDFPDSNPFGVLITKGRGKDRPRTFVADAGANTINEVMPDGTARVIAYIPNETAPPFRDATPTCVALGPDGMLYVATLHFVANMFVLGPNQSDVWRVNPDANFPEAPTLWASGLTTPAGCTFDHDGNFWATELFQPNDAGPPGDVVRIPFRHPDRMRRIGGGSVPLPGSIAEGPDGAMYVTVNSASPVPGSGAVVRIATERHHNDD